MEHSKQQEIKSPFYQECKVQSDFAWVIEKCEGEASISFFCEAPDDLINALNSKRSLITPYYSNATVSTSGTVSTSPSSSLEIQSD